MTGGQSRILMHVLLVEVPGNSDVRMGVEAAIAAAGHVLAVHPAESDVLLVCGTPGPELRTVIDRVWDQMPYPKHRVTVTDPHEVGTVLTASQEALADRRAQRSAGRENAIGNTDGRDSEEDEHPKYEHSSDADDAGESMQDHDMTMGGHDHMSMDHMSMSGPGGYPLAGGADDRDGLEMDVLNVPLGPVLPHWPAGLVLRCALQGDVITEAQAELLDYGTRERVPLSDAVARRMDNIAALLALAGWGDAAAEARGIRDALLDGGHDTEVSARTARLVRRVGRSRVLRWSLPVLSFILLASTRS